MPQIMLLTIHHSITAHLTHEQCCDMSRTTDWYVTLHFSLLHRLASSPSPPPTGGWWRGEMEMSSYLQFFYIAK